MAIVLMGEFNLPSVTWYNGYGNITSSPNYGSGLNTMFLDVINDDSLEQFVHLPPLQHNIYCIWFFSTHPKITNLDVVPGISDHDVIKI